VFFLIEFIFELLAELFLQLMFTLGFRRVADVFNKPLIPAIIFGILSGFVSLLFFDELIISNDYARIINLILTPVLLGLFMALLGKFYRKLGVIHSSLDSFISGFCFGMAMALVRFIFGQ